MKHEPPNPWFMLQFVSVSVQNMLEKQRANAGSLAPLLSKVSVLKLFLPGVVGTLKTSPHFQYHVVQPVSLFQSEMWPSLIL